MPPIPIVNSVAEAKGRRSAATAATSSSTAAMRREFMESWRVGGCYVRSAGNQHDSVEDLHACVDQQIEQ